MALPANGRTSRADSETRQRAWASFAIRVFPNSLRAGCCVITACRTYFIPVGSPFRCPRPIHWSSNTDSLSIAAHSKLPTFPATSRLIAALRDPGVAEVPTLRGSTVLRRPDFLETRRSLRRRGPQTVRLPWGVSQQVAGFDVQVAVHQRRCHVVWEYVQ